MARKTPKARTGLVLIRSRFAYDPATGVVSWLNGKRTGQEAGTVGRHYRQITVEGITYFSHIIAWALMTGEFPPSNMHLDHISRDKLDNRWVNLRLVTPSQNKMNEVERSRRASVVKGAHWDERRAKWRLRLTVNGRCRYIGQFSTIDEVRTARIEAERRIFGQFAPNRA